MKTARFLLVSILLIFVFGCRHETAQKETDKAKARFVEAQKEFEKASIELVKTPDTKDWIAIFEVPTGERSKKLMLAYLETHNPSVDTIMWLAHAEPNFDIELAEFAVSKQPLAALYISYKFGGTELVRQALKEDKDLFARADPDVRIHDGVDSMSINWTPELAAVAYKSNPKFADSFPRTSKYKEYYRSRK